MYITNLLLQSVNLCANKQKNAVQSDGGGNFLLFLTFWNLTPSSKITNQ